MQVTQACDLIGVFQQPLVSRSGNRHRILGLNPILKTSATAIKQENALDINFGSFGKGNFVRVAMSGYANAWRLGGDFVQGASGIDARGGQSPYIVIWPTSKRLLVC